MERKPDNRRCSDCLFLTEVIDKGKPTAACRMGRRVFVAKSCDDELNKRDGGARFANMDDFQLWDEKLLGS